MRRTQRRNQNQSPCSTIFSLLLLQSPPLGWSETFLKEEDKGTLQKVHLLESSSKAMKAAIGATVGIGVAVIGAPVAIWAAGFTGAGIAAGSVAAKMMSAAAIANGGGVAAGSLVSALQSAGAVGLSLGAKVGLGTALGSVGAAVGSWFSKNE
ncbi:interferon alpha-inducible protein 27-like protein 2A isoform X4 [Chelonia mydas]|uniref:interferon alpha-inducible protein 27-like protein 2A isoform X4 n=1 Tax=Chelonia mydas TaxID=8469 RepID=UPI0018A22264|nr:interferon alpha-inducible protein 27-like protein 2A isoform X4 [Chelonia mydas]